MIWKSQMVKYLIFTACLWAGTVTATGSLAADALQAPALRVSGPAAGIPDAAPAPPNPMHPAFKLLDARGEVILQGGQEPDQIRTCGQCHSAAFISEHNLLAHQQRKIACLSCHYEGGGANWSSGAFEPNGLIKREWIKISKPSISNCGGCHGLTGTPNGTVSIPEDYRVAAYPSGTQELERYQLTRSGGSIFSPEQVETSFLNLSGKQGLMFPWDAHARKLLQCTDCHFAPNNPQRPGSRTDTTAGLRGEPRRETLSEYLKQPDHRLATANCQTCHEAQRGHGFLPYPERHLQVVACESCHIPRQFGPAEQMVDATLLDESGSPLVEYRGVEGEAANLNVAYSHGSEPALLAVAQQPGSSLESSPAPVHRENVVGTARLGPVNLVSRWYWTSGGNNEPVAREVLQQALMINGHYRPEVIAALDTDHDGRIDRRELRLDTESKRKTVERLLMAAGVKNPVIRSEVVTHRINHGVAAKSQALSDCLACHGADSRLKSGVVLASWTPGGVAPVWKGETPVPGLIEMQAGGKVVLKPQPGVSQNLHVFGLTSKDWTDRLGLLMLVGVVLTVALHAGFRIAGRRGRNLHASGNAVEMETGDERAVRPETDREKCTKCGQCYSLCPDMAYSKDAEGYYIQNYYWCKGCGTCAKECPVDAITMTQEVD